MKKIYITIFTVLFLACSKDKQIAEFVPSTEVAFETTNLDITLDPVTKMINDTWEIGDGVGIFMKSNNRIIHDISDPARAINKYYKITNINGNNGVLKASNLENTLYYPVGSLVSFIAYYPYMPAAGAIIPINLTTTPNLDLMYASSLGPYNRNSGSVSFNFKHKFARLFFTASPDNTITQSDLENMTLSINNVGLSAQFNMETGEFISIDNQVLNMTSPNYRATIIPDKVLSSKTFTITLPKLNGLVVEKSINVQYTENNQYSYNLIVGKKGISISGVTVKPWTVVTLPDRENNAPH